MVRRSPATTTELATITISGDDHNRKGSPNNHDNDDNDDNDALRCPSTASSTTTGIGSMEPVR